MNTRSKPSDGPVPKIVDNFETHTSRRRRRCCRRRRRPKIIVIRRNICLIWPTCVRVCACMCVRVCRNNRSRYRRTADEVLVADEVVAAFICFAFSKCPSVWPRPNIWAFGLLMCIYRDYVCVCACACARWLSVYL